MPSLGYSAPPKAAPTSCISPGFWRLAGVKPHFPASPGCLGCTLHHGTGTWNRQRGSRDTYHPSSPLGRKWMQATQPDLSWIRPYLCFNDCDEPGLK